MSFSKPGIYPFFDVSFTVYKLLLGFIMKVNVSWESTVPEDHILVTDGQPAANGADLVDTTGDAFDENLKMSLRTRTGVVNSDTSVVKTKRSANLRFVSTDAVSGVQTINLARVEFEVHPDLPDVDFEDLRKSAAKLITGNAAYSLRTFWSTGNVDSEPLASV